MRSATTLLTAILFVVFAVGCDSSGDDGRPNIPSNVITGFFIVLEAPAGTTVSYTVTEYNEFGAAGSTHEAQTVQFETGGSRVLDLFDAGADPAGVQVTARQTAGSGTLVLQLWGDQGEVERVDTGRLNVMISVRGGTAK